MALVDSYDDHMEQVCDHCGKSRMLYNIQWDIVEQDVKSNWGSWIGNREEDRDYCCESCRTKDEDGIYDTED